jgi:hypothetical protein
MVEQRTAGPGEINHALFDPYSLVHGLVGVVAAIVLRLGLVATLAIAVGWEFAEHVLKDLVPRAFPHPTQDTWQNSAGDVISTMIGWAVARAVRDLRAARRPG